MIKKHIPNFITTLNIFSGCVAVYLAFKGNSQGAFIAILIAAIFDFFDGFAARLLKAYSPMGKELDSLADMISFGLAPGAIVFSLLSTAQLNEWLPFLAFLIPIFSGLRLAKFNIDDRQTSSFIGLPVPANAIFWAGIIYSFSPFLMNNISILLILIGLFCYFLISEIPMFSLKFKNVKWKDNQLQFIFLIVSFFLLIILQLSAFAPIIGWYILLSIGISLFKKTKQ
ncbi:MAG: CDP-diacylglycerol--serine O-phosphatidyltransferase [Paludibacter sp.]|nr:CDP-diacylglycerol--serine O-phosphatidyltransferase [Paludibacter sp.]